ncbi:hypothetical protein [Rathayibacter sp. VKM Ac-2760]|uniref:hypothetical protein n=1 Tax=Rathayibacter sp. VKM Ac-2760 TaxID=2609253 RepID=UPI001318C2B8|nr:hypothetical protein [Rathayibacter sp. VKM Ac-2760]QHC57714.1 hypothetical protein GSU72_03340 [Rathayibacter sp. VKM Ac-2760]
MKLRKFLAATAVAGVLTIGFAGPGYAATSSLTATGAGDPVASSDSTVQELEALAKTQPAAEVWKIVASGVPAEVLFDPKTDEYLAAITTEPLFSTSAISAVGPGCSTTSACAYKDGKTPYGYAGSGSLEIDVTDVTKIRGGDRLTTFWSGNTGYYANANVTVNLTSAVDLTKVTRGR